jgi:hypothetical protein
MARIERCSATNSSNPTLAQWQSRAGSLHVRVAGRVARCLMSNKSFPLLLGLVYRQPLGLRVRTSEYAFWGQRSLVRGCSKTKKSGYDGRGHLGTLIGDGFISKGVEIGEIYHHLNLDKMKDGNHLNSGRMKRGIIST